ncbi:hypothetical protein uav_039 [Pseudomonas phage UAVern]|uniref:Uncharacterized protein n=1 Tax=Pseudomonas phage UAVern TaxID=2856997 RepID=A0A975UU71_9CAUD|nr:hypothetical protein uav_039 [Pseudomonas phage UAVern]
MELSQVKIGQKVRIGGAALFHGYNVGLTGVVSLIDGDYVTVDLDDGDNDYGYARGLELIEDVGTAPSTVKEAIAKVESALAELKALVG